MLKRQVIKNLTATVSLLSYLIGSVVCACLTLNFTDGTLNRFLGFYYYETDGFLCLLNSFVWIFGIFIFGLSLIGFFGILPAIYYKMYSLGFLITAAAIKGGQESVLFILCFLPEVIILFWVFSEFGSGAICFSLYILESISILPKPSKNLSPNEKITFKEYLLGGAVAFFLATLLLIYENTVIILL